MNNEHIQKMRDAALVASSIIAQTAAEVKVGVTTNELDFFAARLVDKLQAKPYNLGYKPDWASTPYPAVLCTSVNNEIAHGIPDDYALKEGDIITLDIGIIFNGACGDCAITVPVGSVEEKHERLLRYANRAVYIGINEVRAGALVTNIGKAIDKYTQANKFVTCQVFSGHGIGEEMHQEPTIPNFYSHDKQYLQRFGMRTLKAGEVICIEPIISFKDRGGKQSGDGWTILTRDNGFSAMFEHMVLVTEDGHEILTDHFIKA
jgi:methionyl aminopeptidase